MTHGASVLEHWRSGDVHFMQIAVIWWKESILILTFAYWYYFLAISKSFLKYSPNCQYLNTLWNISRSYFNDHNRLENYMLIFACGCVCVCAIILNNICQLCWRKIYPVTLHIIPLVHIDININNIDVTVLDILTMLSHSHVSLKTLT